MIQFIHRWISMWSSYQFLNEVCSAGREQRSQIEVVIEPEMGMLEHATGTSSDSNTHRHSPVRFSF